MLGKLPTYFYILRFEITIFLDGLNVYHNITIMVLYEYHYRSIAFYRYCLLNKIIIYNNMLFH